MNIPDILIGKLCNRIRVDRGVYIIEEDYGACPKLICTNFKKKNYCNYNNISLI